VKTCLRIFRLLVVVMFCLAPVIASAQSNTGATLTAVPAQNQSPPALRAFSPTSGAQGSTVTLTFTGAYFRKPVGLQFSPATGLSVISVAVVGPYQIQATVKIDPTASPGPRRVMLVVADQSLPAPTPFTVTSSQQPCETTGVAGIPCPPPPGKQPIRPFKPIFRERVTVLRVTPNQIPAGSQNVELKLEGTNFAPGAAVNFSSSSGAIANVFPQGPSQFVNSTEIHIVVNVLASAVPGGRDVTVTDPDHATGTGKGLLSITALAPVKKVVPSPHIIKLTPIAFQAFVKGKISLDEPKWGDRWEGEFEVHHGIPLLNDDTVLKWREQNPGLADYFELCIYARDGKTLLAKKRIDGRTVMVLGHSMNIVPTYFRPDPAFLAEVLAKVTPPQRSLVYPQWGSSAVAKQKASPTPPSPPSSAPKLTDGDMQWEVAGFRTYNKNGTAKFTAKPISGKQTFTKPGSSASSGGSTAQTGVEVEVSDRWPLAAPQAPNGLDNCPSTLTSGKGIQTTDVGDPSVIDKNGKIIPGAVAVSDYVGDPIVLSGDFDLSRSPYAAHPSSTLSKCDGCFLAPVQQFQFNNLFVDWGDGHVDPISAPPTDPNTSSWNSGLQLSLPQCKPSPSCPYSISHTYNYPGVYNVRVFLLSDADVQKVDPSLVAASVDGPTVDPYMAAFTVSQMGGASSSKAAFNSAVNAHVVRMKGPSPADVAKRAYMLYCNQLKITNAEDLLADGPLHLVSIDDPDFPGHDVGKGKTGLRRATPPASTNLQLNPQVKSPSAMRMPGQAATSTSASAAKDQSGQMVRATGAMIASPGTSSQPAAICSVCDESLVATTKLHYYGRGRVRVIWRLDNGTWPSGSKGEVVDIGPSDQRPNLKRKDAASGKPLVSPPASFTSQALSLALTGDKTDHVVSVEAEVVPTPLPRMSVAIADTLSNAIGMHVRASGNASQSKVALQAKLLLNSLAPPPGSKLPPLKVGFLSPSKTAAPGMGAVQYANNALSKVANLVSQAGPSDQHVYSGTQTYEVVKSDPTQPCTFHFPVAGGGHFDVSGLQNHITKSGDSYDGTGNLIVHLATATGYTQYPPIPVKIKGWVVPDGQNVQTGTIDVSPALTLDADTPGLSGTIDRLQGTAGDKVTATLSVSLTDKTVRVPGVEKPPHWSSVAGTLTPDGDWQKDGLTLPLSLLGWSSFTIQSNSVRLDLSHHDGDAAGSLCGGASGAGWVGVRLTSATVVPFTMDLVASSSIRRTVTDWGIVGSGLCGHFSTGAFTANLGDGSVHFDSIDATAQNGTFNALYKGMDVHVPWLDTDLTGDAQLQAGGGHEAYITFPLNGTASPKNYTNVTLKASNLQFTKVESVGWAVEADAKWDFTAENKHFAGFTTNMFFGMDGHAYFAKGNPTQKVSLGGSSSLGATPLDLVSVQLSGSAAGKEILDFFFQTTVHLSEVMPATPVQVNYSINKSGTAYSAAGPRNSPFTVDVPYPSGQPSSEAHVYPQYKGGSHTEYSGSVDLSELGGPPVKGEFRLGYQGGHDYWITRVTIGLGSQGVTLIPAPPIMNLYAIRGGLGHNFPLSAFKNVGSLNSLSPVIDGSFLFMAGMRVGMPDKFTYMLDGDLTIKATGKNAGARMDFRAWLLKNSQPGNGDFQGYFQYAGNNFDGRLWGHLDFMNGNASLDLGNSENNAAIEMHFGGGSWHIDAGKKEGPRIRGHFLIAEADCYVMLGSEVGLALGGSEHVKLDVGDDSVASAYVHADMDMGVQITPQPHLIGDFSASAGAGVCAFDVCVSDNVTAHVHVEAVPVDIRATASLPLPWPLSDITFTVHL
jgi:hypothetical protein